jgi:hypothetical protein
MRWLCLLLSLVVVNLMAEEVTATGHGHSVDEALQNAKTAAVEQVAGTFIVGTATVEGARYRSRIDQYNGGLIRTHRVVSVTEQEGLIVVRIKADVDTDKVNSVIVSTGMEITEALSAQLAKSRDDHEKTLRIVEALDNPAQAFAVQVKKVTYTNHGEMTDVLIEAQIGYSPKWYDDVRVMAKTIGREVNLGSAWADVFWGLGALSAVANPALPGIIHAVARRLEGGSPKESPEYMACFGTDNGRDIDECYEIRHPMPKTTGSSKLRVGGQVTIAGREFALTEIVIDCGRQLFMDVASGQKAYFVKSSKMRQFTNPGVLFFQRGGMTFRYALTASTRESHRHERSSSYGEPSAICRNS